MTAAFSAGANTARKGARLATISCFLIVTCSCSHGCRKYPVLLSQFDSGGGTESTYIDRVESIDANLIVHCEGLGRVDPLRGLLLPTHDTVHFPEVLAELQKLCGKETRVIVRSMHGEEVKTKQGILRCSVVSGEGRLDIVLLRRGLALLSRSSHETGSESVVESASLEAERMARAVKRGLWALEDEARERCVDRGR
jgi:hypothetical protein